VEFRILGPLEVLDGETPVQIAGSKRRAVLALLLLHPNEVVRTERLIDELWGEHPPRNATAALHSHVSRLRKAVGPDLLARREWGYVLRADPDSIDLRRFEQLVAAAEPLPARERSAKLSEALALWRGPALADLAAEPSLETESARLDELRVTTLERRIDADLEAGRNAQLVGEIETLIAAHPLREHLRWQLILALYRAGRQAEALEVYRETRRVLTDELGLEPSPALKELEKAILRQDPAIASASAVPLAPASERRPPRSKRRRVVIAALALGVLGAGVGTAVALVDRTGSHRTAHATSVAATSSAATAQSAQPTSGPQHVVKRTLRPRHSGRQGHHQSRQPAARIRTKAPAKASAAAPPVRGKSKSRPTSTGTHARTKKPKIVTITDDFSGNQIDGTIWYQVYLGTGWNLSQQDGHLEFTFPPGTTPGPPYDNFGGHVGTRCKFPGDFDARVDFTLVQWPTANGILVSLWSFFQNIGWESWRRSSTQWGEQYGSYTGSATSVALDDASGTLRIVRRNGVVTTYFLHNGKWQPLTSGSSRSLATIAVGASDDNDAAGHGIPFPGKQVVVDFDNFRVRAADPICPPGAQGSG